MTVKELIEELQTFPQNMEVYTDGYKVENVMINPDYPTGDHEYKEVVILVD
jgi:hypothetical protein